MLESYCTECKFDMGQSGSAANASYEFNRASCKLVIMLKEIFFLFAYERTIIDFPVLHEIKNLKSSD